MTTKIIKKIKEKEELEKKKKEAYKIGKNRTTANFNNYHKKTETNFSRNLRVNKSLGNFLNKNNSKKDYISISTTIDAKKKRKFMTPGRALKTNLNNERKAHTPGKELKDFQKDTKKLFDKLKTSFIDKNDKKIKSNKNLNNQKKENRDKNYENKNNNKTRINRENNFKKEEITKKNIKKCFIKTNMSSKNFNNKAQNKNLSHSQIIDNKIKNIIMNNSSESIEKSELTNKNIENNNSNNNISSATPTIIISETKTEKKPLTKTIFLHFLYNFKKIQKFLTKSEILQILKINKESSRSILKFLKEQNNIKIENALSQLAEFKSKISSQEYTKPIPNFKLGKGGLKAITLLDEEKYRDLFSNNKIPSNDIILVYKILYQLSNEKSEILKKDDKSFWEFVKNDMNKQIKLGEYVKNLFKNFNFSNENVQKIKEMTEGSIDKLTPTYYSKLCPTTGLFIFFIKDVLEYIGIIIDKKTCASRIYKNLEYNLSFYKEKETKIEKLLKMVN